jgi:hypothetical protein
MKKTSLPAALFPLAIYLLISAGCSKHGAQALAPEKVSAAMDKAFVKASGEPQEMAQEISTACQSNDTVTAFADLEKLSHRTDLTPEQRSATAHAMATLFGKLRADSDNGDQAAQAAVHQYISTR